MLVFLCEAASLLSLRWEGDGAPHRRPICARKTRLKKPLLGLFGERRSIDADTGTNEAIRRATRHDYASGDIDRILMEFESGYGVGKYMHCKNSHDKDRQGHQERRQSKWSATN